MRITYVARDKIIGFRSGVVVLTLHLVVYSTSFGIGKSIVFFGGDGSVWTRRLPKCAHYPNLLTGLITQ